MGTAYSAYLLISPNLNKTRLCKTKGNSIQLSYRQQQITMGTAYSTHPLLSPSLNQTIRTLSKYQENSFQPSYQQQQITLCTVHSIHQPLTSPSLNLTIRILWRTPKNSFQPSHQQQQITVCTGYSSQHGKFKKRRNQSEMLNEIGTRSSFCIWQPFHFILPQPQIIGKNTMFHGLPKISCLFSSNSSSSFLLLFSAFHLSNIVGLLDPNFLRLYIHFKISRIIINNSTFSPRQTLRTHKL